MIQNYKYNEIKIKCSEFSHTIDATFLKIRSALSHAFIAKCFRSEISLGRLRRQVIGLHRLQVIQTEKTGDRPTGDTN